MSRLPLPPVADRGALLDEWVEVRREIARLEARATELLAARAAVFDADAAEFPQHRDAARRSMAAEYAAAGRVGRGTVEAAFADAEAVAAHFPAIHDALRAGAITVQHVRALVAAAEPVRDAVRNERLPADALALYENAALVVAEQDSPARTRVHARQIAATLAGETLRERHARATAERSITVRPMEDGMALLTAVLPEIYAVAIKDRLTRLAGAIATGTRSQTEAAVGIAFSDPTADGQLFPPEVDAADLAPDDPRLDAFERIASGTTYALDPEHDLHDPAADTCLATRVGPDARPEFVAGDGRTRRQIEADAFIDLLLASDPSEALGTGLDRITATLQVTVRGTTLAGDDDRLAELDGHGPLHPDLARDLAGRASGWNRLFLDGDGMITRTDRYTPTEAMKRHLRARDQRCRFPGCHTPATRCDIDHNHDHARGGPTSIDNLACFCRAHHALKHPDLDEIVRWQARQRPDGTVEWTSPLGRSYPDPAPRRVMFT
ncbi:HNH endonuclease signature motif containing protein [Microbacterium sp. ASV81]|uniref:DUF222 domain-containing protein n=1 Tax=Microbacterium capsulatum TaxID=3041921 RepID=A0ABU0XKA4_9MICO|nr:DUF222 domain-containing protein [Microbacterium sp. ASV81]MDQ4215576.1 DUF222 domain-containing protein [Microbacterium sp. ASV81]